MAQSRHGLPWRAGRSGGPAERRRTARSSERSGSAGFQHDAATSSAGSRRAASIPSPTRSATAPSRATFIPQTSSVCSRASASKGQFVSVIVSLTARGSYPFSVRVAPAAAIRRPRPGRGRGRTAADPRGRRPRSSMGTLDTRSVSSVSSTSPGVACGNPRRYVRSTDAGPAVFQPGHQQVQAVRRGRRCIRDEPQSVLVRGGTGEQWHVIRDTCQERFRGVLRHEDTIDCDREADPAGQCRAASSDPVLRGVCRTEHTIRTYLDVLSCPHCDADSTRGCRLHRHLYFADMTSGIQMIGPFCSPGRVNLDLGRLDREMDVFAGDEVEVGGGGRGDVGDQTRWSRRWCRWRAPGSVRRGVRVR